MAYGKGRTKARSEFARLFGLNLAKARRRFGLSQEELGFRASMHRTAVGQLERGERSPLLDSAVRLAGTLEVPIDSLLEGIGWKLPEFHQGGFSYSPGDPD
jgi:transcriptional regulator with XRE-family HTH domain